MIRDLHFTRSLLQSEGAGSTRLRLKKICEQEDHENFACTVSNKNASCRHPHMHFIVQPIRPCHYKDSLDGVPINEVSLHNFQLESSQVQLNIFISLMSQLIFIVQKLYATKLLDTNAYRPHNCPLVCCLATSGSRLLDPLSLPVNKNNQI